MKVTPTALRNLYLVWSAHHLHSLGVPDANIQRHVERLATAKPKEKPKPSQSKEIAGVDVHDDDGNDKRSRPPETRAKVSAALKGRTCTWGDKIRDTLVAAHKNGTISEESLKRMSWLGRHHTAETKAKLSAIRKGRRSSTEHRAQLSATRKGWHHSPETKAKMSAAHKGMRHSDEAKAKISAAFKGKPLNAEHRAKISAALKGRRRERVRLSAAAKARLANRKR